jgi:Skp family chaperone for outer membrane proteins
MTLINLTPEQKAQHFKDYAKQYNKLYYQRQREEDNERYQKIKEQAKERYYKKKAELNPDKPLKQYKKTNIVAEIPNPQAEIPNIAEPPIVENNEAV